MPSWSLNIEARTFQRIFALGIFWGELSRYAATPLIVALSPGHSDITRFRPWSPIATGSHLDHAEKIPKVAQTTGIVDVFDPCSGISGPTFQRASPCPNLHEWWTQPLTWDASCSAIDLAIIRWSSKISSWIWSIISGVVTVLGRPGRGASLVEKSPPLNWATLFLMLAYNDACSPDVSFRMAWIFFSALPCRKNNLMTGHVSMLLKPCTSPDMLPFSLCNQKRLGNSAHEQTPLSNDTINFILLHREVGRAKDLSAPPRTDRWNWGFVLPDKSKKVFYTLATHCDMSLALTVTAVRLLTFWLYKIPFVQGHSKQSIGTRIYHCSSEKSTSVVWMSSSWH